jgi:hypothetical protein
MRAIITTLFCTLIAAAPLTAADDAAPTGKGHHRAAVKAKVLARFDADKDGTLSKEERAAARAACEARLLEKHPEADTNSDGQLSREEIKAWREAHGKGKRDGKRAQGDTAK